MSFLYRSKVVVVRTLLLALGVAFEMLSKRSREMKDEIEDWEDGRVLCLGVLPAGPSMAVRKENGALHYIGKGHHDTAIEPTGPEQRRVEHVGPVGGRQQDHTVVALETVHFDQQLVERLLALVVTATETGAAVPSDRVDSVDEQYARCVLLALVKKVAHTGSADAHEHLHKIRSAH